MKTTIFAFISGFIIFCTASCKKESTDSKKQLKIGTYTVDLSVRGASSQIETFTINYDNEGRITSVVSTTKPGHRYNYQYINDNQFTQDKIEDNKVIAHSLFFINSSISLVDSVYSFNIQNDTTSAKYIYNDNQLVEQKQYLHSYLLTSPLWINTVNYQYDQNGVLTKDADDYYESTYVYADDIDNTVQIEPAYIPAPKKLPSITFTTRWGTTNTIHHTYTFDGDKRITSEKAESSDGTVTVTSYTYQ